MADTLSPIFSQVMTAQMQAAAAFSRGLLNLQSIPAECFATSPLAPANPHSETETAALFSRTDLTRRFRGAIENPTEIKAKDAIASKVQSDLLSQAQRDYTTQFNATRITALVRLASRKQAEGAGYGGIARGLMYRPLSILRGNNS